MGDSRQSAVFHHRALLISVNISIHETTLYEAVRYAWKLDPARAAQADVILATANGEIVGAFVADAWLEATPRHFPHRVASPGRYGFVGREAPAELAALYVGKRVPDEYRRFGAANPIKYTWKP
jgi:uncharacterized protein